VRLLDWLLAGVTGLARGMAHLAGWNYLAAALFITADIVGRAAFGISSAATVEVTGYMLAIGIAWALAHALLARAHVRVDVWVNRLPSGVRAPLHLFALALLGVFAGFCAWAAYGLVDESLLFDAHDNSALRIPLALPQGLWTFGIWVFCLVIAVLLSRCALALLRGRPQDLDRLLGARGIDDETAEALAAARMTPRA